MVGRTWRDRWEDGEDGVFRAEDTTRIKVAKTAELNDPELAEADVIGGLFNRTASKAGFSLKGWGGLVVCQGSQKPKEGQGDYARPYGDPSRGSTIF